jgi:hypothetical protein
MNARIAHIGHKEIGLSDKASRESNGGYPLVAVDDQAAPRGCAKSYMAVSGQSKLSFDQFSVNDFKTVQLVANGVVRCFDSGTPEPLGTKIYVIKDALMKNVAAGNDLLPTIAVERGNGFEYSNSVEILGPCNILYSDAVNHPLGGSSWIETDAEVQL